MSRGLYRLLLQSTGGGGGGGGPNGFTGKYTFTIDHTQCGSADSSNFPVCIRSTLAPLKSTGNGGGVTNANGYDIVLCSDTGLTSLLDFELESWDATTGAIVAWVRLPALSHTSDTVFYLGYGKSSITTDQSNQHGTWDSNFGAVYHFGSSGTQDYSIGRRTDSTSNGNTLANGASLTTPATGQIGKALDVNNSTQVLSAGDAASIHPTAGFTVEAWVKPPDYSGYRCAVGKGNNSAPRRNYSLFTEQTTGHAMLSVTKSSAVTDLIGTSAISTSVFTHVVGTYDGANLRLYVNGTQENSVAYTGSVDTNAADNLWVGCLDYGFGAFFPFGALGVGGLVDEVRVSSLARSASWVLAQYNNQKTSSTFYTVT
jgi:hypothetical protein